MFHSKTFSYPSTDMEGAVLSSACTQLWHCWRHHLQRAVEAAEWRAGEHPAQGEANWQNQDEKLEMGLWGFVPLKSKFLDQLCDWLTCGKDFSAAGTQQTCSMAVLSFSSLTNQ